MAGYLSISTDFEGITIGNNVPAPWGPSSGNQTATVVQTAADGGAAHAGNRQAQCSWSGTNGTTITTFGVNLAAYYSDEFLLNAWVRFDNSITFEASGGSGVHALEFFDSGSDSSWLMTNAIAGSGNLHFQARANAHDVFTNFYPSSVNHTWHFYQYYFKLSTGVYKVWYDNTLVPNASPPPSFPVTDGNTFKWDRYDFIANYGSNLGTVPQYIYVDDVQIFTDSNSLGLGTPITSGSMANGDAAASGGGTATFISPWMKF